MGLDLLLVVVSALGGALIIVSALHICVELGAFYKRKRRQVPFQRTDEARAGNEVTAYVQQSEPLDGHPVVKGSGIGLTRLVISDQALLVNTYATNAGASNNL